jgi:hypothetical protein
MVDTPAMSITLKASARMMPGSAAAQTIMASDAISSSVSMPAAPTRARRHLLRKPLADVASTYGTGMNTRSRMPMSWISPPPALAA